MKPSSLHILRLILFHKMKPYYYLIHIILLRIHIPLQLIHYFSINTVGNIGRWQILEHQDDVWRALYQGGKDELLLFLRQESILDFTIHTPTIEDQFMSLYEGGTIDDSFKN